MVARAVVLDTMMQELEQVQVAREILHQHLQCRATTDRQAFQVVLVAAAVVLVEQHLHQQLE